MFGRRSQRDFKDEIRSHLELEAERLRAEGLSPEEAEREARRTFGNVDLAEERFRVAQPFAWLGGLGRDLDHGWRALLRSPAFLVTAVGTLALAIGAVAGMFAVVDTVLLRPLPFPSPDRLVAIGGTAPGSDLPERFDVGSEFYLRYKDSKLLDGVAVYGAGTSTLRTDDRVERVAMAFPTVEMWSMFGLPPQLGRLPVKEDEEQVVVISDSLWSSWFARDPAVIGKTYYIAGKMRQVVGVMPPEFRFPTDQTLIWVASAIKPEEVHPGDLGANMIARMKPGVTPAQLSAELTLLSKELPARYGGSPSYARLIQQHQAVVEPLLDRMMGPATTTSLWLLLGAVGFVLLIACANVANLFLVRAEGRRRDMAVRRALGASRAQLVRLQMAEAFLVALVAGVLGVVFSAVALPSFLRLAPPGIPRLALVHVDLAMVAATFALVLLAALFCGALPALRASSPDLASMRDGGRGATEGRGLARNLLVVGQTALALVLLIGSALLVESFQRLRNVDPGYRTADLYTFQFAPQQPGLTDGPSWGQLHLAFMDRLRALPGVTEVGIVENVPLDEGTADGRFLSDTMADDAGGALLAENYTAGDYFHAMGIALLQGRTFTRDEAVTPNENVIVSRSVATKLWGKDNPLGKRIRRLGADKQLTPFTVVGVVDDVKQLDWREPGAAVVYFPLTGPTPTAWSLSSPAYVVKSPRAGTLTAEVRQLVHQIAPEAPVYREYTMDFLAQRSRTSLSFTMLTLGVVSILALILGAVGLYGVLSYVVAARTREIGLRMALGATPGKVRRQVVSQGTQIVLIGVIIGVGAAVLATRLLATLLYQVEAVDEVVFLSMSLMMVAIGALASYLPARRASSVDPMVSLRND